MDSPDRRNSTHVVSIENFQKQDTSTTAYYYYSHSTFTANTMTRNSNTTKVHHAWICGHITRDSDTAIVGENVEFFQEAGRTIMDDLFRRQRPPPSLEGVRESFGNECSHCWIGKMKQRFIHVKIILRTLMDDHEMLKLARKRIETLRDLLRNMPPDYCQGDYVKPSTITYPPEAGTILNITAELESNLWYKMKNDHKMLSQGSDRRTFQLVCRLLTQLCTEATQWCIRRDWDEIFNSAWQKEQLLLLVRDIGAFIEEVHAAYEEDVRLGEETDAVWRDAQRLWDEMREKKERRLNQRKWPDFDQPGLG